MRFVFVIVCCLALLSACAARQNESAPERHYPLSGTVVAVNLQDRTATIDAAAIPNFMEAMTMAYPVKSEAELRSLHAGDKITATVNVREEGVYDLSGIKVQPPGK